MTKLYTISQELEAVPKVVEAAPAALATGSKVAIMDFDAEFKSTTTVVAHDVIVSLAGGMMHGRMIEGQCLRHDFFDCPEIGSGVLI